MDFLDKRIEPFDPESCTTAEDVLEAMKHTAFQGKNLASALDIWWKMLNDDAVIFLGLAGALVPAGMKKIVSYLIKNRFVDCIVSTGANLFHDSHESLGFKHYKGSVFVNDLELKEKGIDRIYDVFAMEDEFQKSDSAIGEFAGSLDNKRAYSTREFLYLWGRYLGEKYKHEEGIVTTAAKHHVPVYCPAIGDSSIGIGIAVEQARKTFEFSFNVLKDVSETAIMLKNTDTTGVIYLGGGTPKNFIQQTEVTASIMGIPCNGHKYAIQITGDSPHWGGLSGCTFEEAQSWGKIDPEALKISINGDVTMALPVLITALCQKAKKEGLKQRRQRFDISGKDIVFLS